MADRLTSHQRRVLRELDEVAELTGVNFHDIRNDEREHRTATLELMKDQLVRGFVINTYTLVDELLRTEICQYFFGGRRQDSIRLWKTRRFRIFNQILLERLPLQEKLRAVREIRELPKPVRSDIGALTGLRNALAHAFFPENQRASSRPVWKGENIFSVSGVKRFADDRRELLLTLFERVFGRGGPPPPVVGTRPGYRRPKTSASTVRASSAGDSSGAP